MLSRRSSKSSSVSSDLSGIEDTHSPSLPQPAFVQDAPPILETIALTAKHPQKAMAQTIPLSSDTASRSRRQSALPQVASGENISSKALPNDSLDPFARPAGSEPGVDATQAWVHQLYSHVHENCSIQVVDYSSANVNIQRMDNHSFLRFLEQAPRQHPGDVRWIDVTGVSWDVLSALALVFDLHPLAVEDVLEQGQIRSKADWFPKHLFVHILDHTLHSPEEHSLRRNRRDPDSNSTAQDSASSTSSSSSDSDGGYEGIASVEDIIEQKDVRRSRLHTYFGKGNRQSLTKDRRDVEHGIATSQKWWYEKTSLLSSRGRQRASKLAQLEALKRKNRVRVHVTNAFFFLFQDGTLISIHQMPLGDQIFDRLQRPGSLLRTEPDASLLLQSCLDFVVDKALAVIEKYHDRILKFERDIHIKPGIQTVQYLHVMSDDLTIRKRALTPIKSLIYGLRRYDLERSAAVQGGGKVAVGYMSTMTKIYLADVYDHIDFILASLDMYSAMTENLIRFSFDMSTYSLNDAMRQLTIVTVIFLPLTLLTGYFGMNFNPMPAVNNHSDALFWQIAIPVIAVLVPLFLWADIRRLLHYLKKRMVVSNVRKAHSRRARRIKRDQRLSRIGSDLHGM